MTDFSLALTTVLKPTKKFTVDGEVFDLLGVDHLTPDDEAETMALFARYAILQEELSIQANVTKGTQTAKELKATRLTLLCKLTTLTPAVAAKLPLTQQVRLLEAIQAEVEAEDEDEPTPTPTPEPEVAEG